MIKNDRKNERKRQRQREREGETESASEKKKIKRGNFVFSSPSKQACKVVTYVPVVASTKIKSVTSPPA